MAYSKADAIDSVKSSLDNHLIKCTNDWRALGQRSMWQINLHNSWPSWFFFFLKKDPESHILLAGYTSEL